MTTLSQFLEENTSPQFTYRTVASIYRCTHNGVAVVYLVVPRHRDYPMSFTVHILYVRRGGREERVDVYVDGLYPFSWMHSVTQVVSKSGCQHHVREVTVSYTVGSDDDGYVVNVDVSGMANCQVRFRYSRDPYSPRVASFEVILCKISRDAVGHD